MRRFKAEALSGAVIEAMHGECGVLCGNRIEAHFLREELADETVHVLVRDAYLQRRRSLIYDGDPLGLRENRFSDIRLDERLGPIRATPGTCGHNLVA